MKAEAAVRLRNVTKSYGEFTLDHITMDIPKGSIVGLVGENGAGKTTLMKIILQIASSQEGEITVDGRKIQPSDHQWKEQVGAILPGVGFASMMNARQLGNCMRGFYRNWQDDVYRQYLGKFQIDPGKLVQDYSQGMKMKLNLALALSHQADLLIFDEATSGLDPVVRDDILDILLEFIQDEGHTVLISSHIVTDLEKVADYIAFLHEGRLLFCMNKDEMLEYFGIVRCTPEEYEKIPNPYLCSFRKNQFGYEALIRNRAAFQKEFPGYCTDHAAIEEIILYHVKGETR